MNVYWPVTGSDLYEHTRARLTHRQGRLAIGATSYDVGRG